MTAPLASLTASGIPAGEGRTPEQTKMSSMADAGVFMKPIRTSLRPTSFAVIYGASVLGIVAAAIVVPAYLIFTGVW